MESYHKHIIAYCNSGLKKFPAEFFTLNTPLIQSPSLCILLIRALCSASSAMPLPVVQEKYPLSPKALEYSVPIEFLTLKL